MALTRDFKQTIAVRASRDSRFREALFTEAINAYLAGNTAEGKAILRDLVNATVGFEGLAAEIHKPSKSLHRMLAPRGNPGRLLKIGCEAALRAPRARMQGGATRAMPLRIGEEHRRRRRPAPPQPLAVADLLLPVT
jgi:hypothetical protein